MKIKKITILGMAVLLLSSFAMAQKSVVPLSSKVVVEDTYTIVWNGTSEAYRFVDGNWVRAENYDYQFVVNQKRYDSKWKSVKTLQRLHPEYDGKAGERDQTMYFEVDYKNITDGKVETAIVSTLGEGTGATDTEFRNTQLTMYVKNASRFLPYNKYRITQKYNYEEGILTETVEILKEKDGKETPFMKNEEKAYIYTKTKLASAPTLFKN
jgi:hypothetical protein